MKKHKMTDEQRSKLKSYQYKRMLEERRGNNFEYWSDKHDKMLENGWDIADFPASGRQCGMKQSTFSLWHARELVEQKRNEGNFSRIVCGYDKNVQRQKMYTVIFKPKQNANKV